MTESNHTPGPWRLYTDAKGRVSKIESKTGRVCTIQPGDKNRDANAALIARAPDLLRENESLRAQNAELLEALRKTRDAWVEEASWGDGIDERHSIILAETDDILTRMQGEEPTHRPAIAKAKGGAS